MPIPDDEMLGSAVEKRLKAALDEVVPPSPHLSSARYRMGAAHGINRAWRFAPALVAIAAAGVALTATAATGSLNPAIWKDRAGTVIENASHFASSSPRATQSAKPEPRQSPDDKGLPPSRPTPSSSHEPQESPQPSERPEPTDSPEPSDSPEASPTPGSDGGHDSSGGPQPSPSPTGGGGD